MNVECFQSHHEQSWHGRKSPFSQRRSSHRNLQTPGTPAVGAAAISSVPWRGLPAQLLSNPPTSSGRSRKSRPVHQPASIQLPQARVAAGRSPQSQLATSHLQAQRVRPNCLVSLLCGSMVSGTASGGNKCSWHKQPLSPALGYCQNSAEEVKGKHFTYKTAPAREVVSAKRNQRERVSPLL